MIVREKYYYLCLLLPVSVLSLILVYKFKIRYIIYIPISIFTFFQIEICNFNSFELIDDYYAFIEVIFIFLTFLIIDLLINKWIFTSYGLVVIYTILAIVNNYVYEFRKIPLVPTDIELAKTAGTMLSHYTITITRRVILCLLLLGINILIISLFKKYFKQSKRSRGQLAVHIFLAVVLFSYVQILFSDAGKTIINIVTVTWDVQYGYWEYGYLLGSIQNFKECEVEKPSSFNEISSIIAEMEVSDAINGDEEKPDIILIVNESYYDLFNISDIKTDRNPMEYIDSLTNLIRGYAVNPNTVTANSEYEILTSNSVEMFHAITAFTHFPSDGINSVTKNLLSLGYETYAIHPALSSNYNRINVYKDLGFNTMNWINDFPEDCELVRDYISDRESFKKIIQLYQNAAQDKPRFIYNLTIQNHGDYNRGINKDIKIVEGSVEDSKKELAEEYLSSLSQTDNAFKELVDYFENVDRKVVICMVGDHSPSFAGEIANKEFNNEKDRIIKAKSTPFIIWSNYQMENFEIGYTSMIYVCPILFKVSGLPLTGYQKYLLEMSQELPIVTVGFYGDGYDYYEYEAESSYMELLNNYFALEYNNFKGNTELYPNIYDYEIGQ